MLTCKSFGYHGQTGAYLDGATGLLQMGARWYAPCVGRFISRDPSGWSNGANLYGFCMGDPVDFFDPNGCDAQSRLNQFWKLVHDADKINQKFGQFGCPPLHTLSEAHDAFENWGTAAGNTKVSAHDTKVAAAYAGAHFADAVMAFAGPALGALGKVGACKGPKCFVAGTPVWVAWQDSKGTWHTGTKPVEQVKAGEFVIARNEQTGKTEYKKVLQTHERTVDLVLAVTLTDAKTGEVKETITATRDHPFYVEGKGFVPAGALAIGNSIVTRAGPALVVKSVEWKRQADGYEVYNFVVDDLHTYFVGNTSGGAWVHNPICIPSSMKTLELSNSSWRQSTFSQDGLVYLLKDAKTGKSSKLDKLLPRSF